MWIWYDDDYYYDDGNHWDNDDDENKFFEWYNGYKKRKAQKANIKEELLPIQQDGEIGVCQKRKKRDRKIMEVNRGFFISCDWI